MSLVLDHPERDAAVQTAIALTLSLIIGLVMVSSDSLWIDELQTVAYAQIDGPWAFVTQATASEESESQMIGYLSYVWAWEKVLGGSEWSLRLSNLPWLLLACWAVVRTSRLLGLAAMPAAFLVQPFLWCYVDELRPYTMQIAGGSLVLWGLAEYVWGRGLESQWAWKLMAGALVVSLGSMLGAVTVAAVLVVMVGFAIRNQWWPEPKAVGVLLGGLVLLGALGAYYAWTLVGGAGGARQWSVGLANFAFTAYEFLGFTGLGLPRDLMREAAKSGPGVLAQAMDPYLPRIAGLAAGYVLLALGAVWPRRRGQGDRKPRVAAPADDALLAASAALWVLALNTLLLLALAYAASWPFWGRHLAPVFPCWVLLLAWGLQRCGSRWWGVLVAAGVLSLLLLSALVLRFSPDHAKDDYRGGAAVARRAVADGQTVWWVAAPVSRVDFYRAPWQRGSPPPRWVEMPAPTPDGIALSAPPDLVLISKPDIHDPGGLVNAYLAEHGFEQAESLKAFAVWRRGR